MTPADFVEEIRTLLHERAKDGDPPPAPATDLDGLLRQVETVFINARQPWEGSADDELVSLRADLESATDDVADARADRDEALGQLNDLRRLFKIAQAKIAQIQRATAELECALDGDE